MNRLFGLLAVGCACSCADIENALAQRRAADDASADGGTATDGGGEGAMLDGGICLNGFCWENPLPQGNRLNAVFGADAGDVWMVGEVGTVLRWTPSGWRSYQSAFPVTETLRSVWARGSDVWAVGTVDTVSAVNPTVMKPRHFDGGSWGEDVWPGPLFHAWYN